MNVDQKVKKFDRKHKQEAKRLRKEKRRKDKRKELSTVRGHGPDALDVKNQGLDKSPRAKGFVQF